ncbi:MAG: helix-turn-helix domain-containing protein [Syntrophomonadales bacterium]
MGKQKQPTYIAEQKPFPRRLRRLMEETKTTQAALAKVVGMTRQGIALYTSGQTTPDIETFVKIADYFNVSYDYLLGYSGSRDRENHDIVEETGLSEKAIEKLKTWVEGVNETDANGVQFTRNVNTKAPKELSAIIESKEFRRLMGYIRALKYVSGEDDGTVKNFFLGPAKVAVLKAELGSRSVRDYIIFLALNTFRDILNEIIPHVPSVDRGWRKATQADMDDF